MPIFGGGHLALAGETFFEHPQPGVRVLPSRHDPAPEDSWLNVDETIFRSQCDEFARPVEILGLGALPEAGTRPDDDPITEAMFLADRKELVAYSACARTWRRIDDE